MALSQLTIQLRNEPGALAGIVKRISEADINIRAMSLAEVEMSGSLRLIVPAPEKSMQLLIDQGLSSLEVKVIKVLAVKMDDQPGALSGILDVIAQEGINISYMYAFTSTAKGSAYVILRLRDGLDAVEQALQRNGFKTLSDAELNALL